MIEKFKGALTLNIFLFVFTGFTLIKVITSNDLVIWKLMASLISFIGFGIFVTTLFVHLIKIKKAHNK